MNQKDSPTYLLFFLVFFSFFHEHFLQSEIQLNSRCSKNKRRTTKRRKERHNKMRKTHARGARNRFEKIDNVSVRLVHPSWAGNVHEQVRG
jgi:hypothetical protein